MSDQLHAEDLGGKLLSFFRGLGQLYATALAASSRMNLRLYHDAFRTACHQTFGDVECFVFTAGHLAARDCDAILRKNALGLIFVNFHSLEI